MVLFVFVSLPAGSVFSASRDDADQGKRVVNKGDKPLTVMVTTKDGQRQELLVPPKSEVPLPKNATQVERDSRSVMNKAAESSKVQVVGNGREVDLPPARTVYKDGKEQNLPPDRQVTNIGGEKMDLPGVVNPDGVVLDPDHPEVMNPAAETIGREKEDFKRREGKTVVNHGDKPLTVVVTTQDGQQQEILVPAKSGVALPAGATKVDRDDKSVWNKAAENSKVQIVGDGKEVNLPPTRTFVGKDGSEPNIPPDRQVTGVGGEKMDIPGAVNPTGVVLDPNRPEVMQPGAEKGTDFTDREGKTVVNHGDKPLTVVVTTRDGEKQDILVPPHSGVALPPGTTNVDRDKDSVWNKGAENSKVQVVGDGKEVDLPPTKTTYDKDGRQQNLPPDRQVTNIGGEKMDLPGVVNPTGVTLDPDRPEVLRPGAEKGTDFTDREGKTVVNHGDKPLTVVVTTADGKQQEILVPPGSGVPLPPGTEKVERDTQSVWNKDAENSKVQVVGDGKEVDLPGKMEGSAVVMDPKRPGVLRPEGEETSEEEQAESTVEPEPAPEPVSAPASSLAGEPSHPCGWLFSLIGASAAPSTALSSDSSGSFDSVDKLNRGSSAPGMDARGMTAAGAAAPQPVEAGGQCAGHAN